MVRAGMRSMLAEERGLEVVGEAGSGPEAVNLCRRLCPDLVLMDIRMPGGDGLAATAEIKKECPATAVIIVTIHDSPDYLLAALKAGAAGYVLKDASRNELINAVRRVLRGESLLQPELAARLLRRLVTTDGEESPVEALRRLTRRELEVLRLLAEGKTNPQIAAELVVSSGTVKNHVEHIIGKLGVSDRTQAAVLAVRAGLLAPEA